MEMISLLLLGHLVLINGGQAQIVEESRMRAAADQLSERFSRLKTFGMGADALQEAYIDADISYSSVGQVDTLLSSTQYNSRVQNVITLIEEITTGNSGGTGSLMDCCLATQALNQVCCFGCEDNPDELQMAAHSITNANLDEEVEFRVGLTNGSVLVYPTVPAQGNCVEEDSRLTSWYNSATESKEREIVIFLDMNQNGLTGNSTQPELEEAAIRIIRSLSRSDKVGLVLVTTNNQRACPLRSATEENKRVLVKVIEETLASGNRVYQSDFSTSLSYFSNSGSVDNLLILITDGRVSVTGEELTDFTGSVSSSLFDNVNFVIYTAREYENSTAFLEHLRPFTNDMSFNPLSEIAGYSSVFIAGNPPPPERTIITTEFNRNDELSLSLSKVWKDGAVIIGAVNVLLPWKYVMEEVANITARRTSSYFFLMNQGGDILYHELFPLTVLIDVSPTFIETDSEFSMVTSSIKAGNSVSSLSVVKTIVIHHFNDSYIHGSVPSSYHCQRVVVISNTSSTNEGLLYACLVLAEQDMDVVDSFNVQNIADVYEGNPSRLPIYHTQISSLPSADQCSASCLLSTEGRVSVQFTSPLTPPTSSEAVIAAYINGSGVRPSDIADNIAEEIAVVSIVGSKWTNRGYVSEAVPIKRRHLATPTGIYLAFPAVELSPSFVPRYLPWYISAAARRNTLSLSGSTTDELGGLDVVYTASYPVTKDTNGGGVLLSIVAADVTQESLRLDVNNAFDNRLCGSGGYDCSVINEYGYFVLHPSDYSSSVILNILDILKYAGIAKSLLENGLLVKVGCNDIASIDIDTRRYFSLSLLDKSTNCFTPDSGCLDFCISSINDTNSFLLTVKTKAICQKGPLRICSGTCLDCTALQTTSISVECPCTCAQAVCGNSSLVQFPSCPTQTTPPSNYEYGTITISGSTLLCDQDRCCGYEESDCISSPICNWCSGESSCISIGSCCSGDTSCCSMDMPTCLRGYCFLGLGNGVCPSVSSSSSPTPSPPSDTTGSSQDQQAAIVGGVIGGVFGIIFLALLVGCCVWYQVCRRPESNGAKERSDFNFADMKVATTNHTALEFQEKESPPINNNEGGAKETASPKPIPTDKKPTFEVVV